MSTEIWCPVWGTANLNPTMYRDYKGLEALITRGLRDYVAFGAINPTKKKILDG